MANKYHSRLKTLKDIQIYLAGLINKRQRNQIDSELCRDLGYLVKILSETISKDENEAILKRLSELEKLSGIPQ